MLKIIEISKTKKGYDLRFDNETTLFISDRTKEEFFIYKGKTLESAEYQKLIEFEETTSPYAYTLTLLARQNYASRTIKEKLRRRKVDEKTIYKVVERLIVNGLINDEEYAKERANYLIKTKNASKKAVIRDLSEKGINKFTIEDILNSYPDDEESKLAKIIQKLLPRYTKLSLRGAEEKISAKLSRDGFSYSDIKDAIRKFNLPDYIDEEKNLTLLADKLWAQAARTPEKRREVVYNKLSKAGYPAAKIKTYLEGIYDED